jgi:hypothetical protein
VVAELGADVDPFVLHLFAALAEKERALISTRTRQALSWTARLRASRWATRMPWQRLRRTLRSEWRTSRASWRTSGAQGSPRHAGSPMSCRRGAFGLREATNGIRLQCHGCSAGLAQRPTRAHRSSIVRRSGFLADRARGVGTLGHTVRGPMKKMSLSESTGPYFGQPHPLGLQSARLKGRSRRLGSQGRVFATRERGSTPRSFGQPRFSKTLKLQLRV